MTVQINELYTWPEIKPGPLYSNLWGLGKIWPVRICVHSALMRGRAKRSLCTIHTLGCDNQQIADKELAIAWFIVRAQAEQFSGWQEVFLTPNGRPVSCQRQPRRKRESILSSGASSKGHREIPRGWIHGLRLSRIPWGLRQEGKLGYELLLPWFQPNDLGRTGRLR